MSEETVTATEKRHTPESVEFWNGRENLVEPIRDHYLRQIRNSVRFLAVLAGIGVAAGIIEGIVIAVRLGPSF